VAGENNIRARKTPGRAGKHIFLQQVQNRFFKIVITPRKKLDTYSLA
jgi:hypothetical protein